MMDIADREKYETTVSRRLSLCPGPRLCGGVWVQEKREVDCLDPSEAAPEATR
jgi:hypothetical protein